MPAESLTKHSSEFAAVRHSDLGHEAEGDLVSITFEDGNGDTVNVTLPRVRAAACCEELNALLGRVEARERAAKR